MERTLLVAVDGSVYSSNSLDYLARLFADNRDISLHLLYVATSGSADKEWMNDVDPLRSQVAGSDKRSILGRKYLKEAEERMLRQGFAPERLQTRVKSASSISSAIREEAERGNFDAIVIGRRGLGAVGTMFFGSTSTDLIEKCHHSPLWIIDGNVSAPRFLLAVHSHPSSLMAADHLAFMLKGVPGAEICLYHSNSVFGSQTPAKVQDFHAQWGKEWCDQYLDLDNFLFYAHAQLLGGQWLFPPPHHPAASADASGCEQRSAQAGQAAPLRHHCHWPPPTGPQPWSTQGRFRQNRQAGAERGRCGWPDNLPGQPGASIEL